MSLIIVILKGLLGVHHITSTLSVLHTLNSPSVPSDGCPLTAKLTPPHLNLLMTCAVCAFLSPISSLIQSLPSPLSTLLTPLHALILVLLSVSNLGFSRMLFHSLLLPLIRTTYNYLDDITASVRSIDWRTLPPRTWQASKVAGKAITVAIAVTALDIFAPGSLLTLPASEEDHEDTGDPEPDLSDESSPPATPDHGPARTRIRVPLSGARRPRLVCSPLKSGTPTSAGAISRVAGSGVGLRQFRRGHLEESGVRLKRRSRSRGRRRSVGEALKTDDDDAVTPVSRRRPLRAIVTGDGKVRLRDALFDLDCKLSL